MRTLSIVSMISALSSLIALVGLSAMTIAPRPGAEAARVLMLIAIGALAVAWLGFAFWVRSRAARQSPLPQWLCRLLICVSVAYSLAVLFLLIG